MKKETAERLSKLYSKGKDNFIKEAQQVHGNKYDYSKVEYKNNRTKICIICPEHGEFWQLPETHLKGSNCPECRKIKMHKKFVKSTEQFIIDALNVHGERYIYSKVNYQGANKKVCIVCEKHGEFYQTPHLHLKGRGCSQCKCNFKLENQIKNILNENKINFLPQHTFDWLVNKSQMYLDFYLPEYNIAIECQGIQHFEPREHFGGEEEFKRTVERDKRKYELCKQNNIKILYYGNHKNCKDCMKLNDILNFLKK